MTGLERANIASASAVWFVDRLRVERSPPSPSEFQFAPTAKTITSAVDARSTAWAEISMR